MERRIAAKAGIVAASGAIQGRQEFNALSQSGVGALLARAAFHSQIAQLPSQSPGLLPA
jgi:hypothetical protein